MTDAAEEPSAQTHPMRGRFARRVFRVLLLAGAMVGVLSYVAGSKPTARVAVVNGTQTMLHDLNVVTSMDGGPEKHARVDQLNPGQRFERSYPGDEIEVRSIEYWVRDERVRYAVPGNVSAGQILRFTLRPSGRMDRQRLYLSR